ncbi:bacterial dynamin-like protein [Glandiceps talaboti]
METIDGLTEEKIDEIDDLMTAFDIADEFEIDIDGDLQTLDQVKNFLRTRIQTPNGSGYKADFNAINLVTKCRQEDEERRKRLQTLYDAVEQQFDSFDDHMTVVLQKEDVIGNFMERVVRIKQSLQSGDCPILVAGETSAGKSSLLNLILGEEILPYSHLSSTSTICILRWGEQRKIRINYMYGRKCEEILIEESGEDLLKKLSKYVHQTRDREKGSNYESIEVFMPIPLLRDGIFIVDSPGIGENDAMDAIVTGYLNEAFAFIYVINSANAGGVQEDRLQKFLRLVLDKKSPDEQMKFNTRAAIFVCNKWDCVPKKESDLVGV